MVQHTCKENAQVPLGQGGGVPTDFLSAWF